MSPTVDMTMKQYAAEIDRARESGRREMFREFCIETFQSGDFARMVAVQWWENDAGDASPQFDEDWLTMTEQVCGAALQVLANHPYMEAE